jgi:DNA end-binding protein Ku
MARSIWSGHLTFGLVSIPVGLHSAVEASEHVSFRLLHRKDHAPIRYKKFCSKEDIEVPADEIVRGYEVQKGKYAVVEGEELEQVHQELNDGDHTIELLQFVDFSSLSPLLFDRPYYLTPMKGGDKPYAVLREALHEMKRVGIARFSLRARPLLAALLPGPEVLALEVMRETSELRSPDRLAAGKATVRPPELKMARSLIEQMSGEFDPTDHPNRYRKVLEKLLASKRRFELEEEPEEAAGGKKKSPKVVDLMDALKRSLAASGAKRRAGKRRAA